MINSSDDAVSVSYDRDTETYRATFDTAGIPPSMAVVKVMADVCESDPTELQPLYDAVDPSWFDILCEDHGSRHGESDYSFTFTYLDHEVTIESFEVIEVRPLSTHTGDSGPNE